MNLAFARGIGLAVLLLAGLPACSKPLAHDALIERSPEVQRRLEAALAAKGPNWHARTEQLLPDGRPRYVNRLILEDSPYLLQHASNPVDWYPWGKEAFDKARREHKPIFLSIGYSTCHWCHVMEKESFDRLDIARKLNTGFVAIKVDREARPDLDHLYMTAVRLFTGHGGWPMTTLLTPEGKVFFGGTYFNHDALTRLLDKAQLAWREQPDALGKQADQLMRQVAAAVQTETAAAALDPALASRTARLLLRGHDSLQGGFGTAPKFPNEPLLDLWLDQAQRDADPAILAALETDLDAMAAGGIYDQIGGGFHRYSTDSEWLVPHFEKMLYNQAQLARLYVAAWRLTGKPDYARVARSTLDFALREMHTPAGGFTSALDADSSGGEGRYYLWAPAELRQTLSADDAAFVIRQYGVSETGNFEGANILHLSHPVSAADRARLDRIDAALLAARSKRPYPHRDDKVLTGWNGLMIAALAEAGDALHEARYINAAKRTAEYLWTRQHRTDGGLWRVSSGNKAGTPGMLEDYAWLAEGYLALYDVTAEHVWLNRAQALADAMQTRFKARDGGAYVLAEPDPLAPLPQTRDATDNATPSPNGIAVAVLARLAKRTGAARYEDAAQAQLAALSGTIANDPTSHASLLIAADDLHLGETGSHQYAGRGAVAVTATSTWTSPRRVVFESTLTIRPGWHINAHQPLQDYLIPTVLEPAKNGWKQVSVDYPDADIVRLGFQKDALALYQGKIHLRTTLARDADTTPGATMVLHLQACSDRVCLPPERLRLPVTAN